MKKFLRLVKRKYLIAKKIMGLLLSNSLNSNSNSNNQKCLKREGKNFPIPETGFLIFKSSQL